MQRLINKLFHYEDLSLNYDGTYMHRWGLFKKGFSKKRLKGRNIYLHHMVGDDWSRDMHNHPKKFWSIGLAGSYVEETPHGKKVYKAPWLRSFPHNHIHRLKLGPTSKAVWTLVFVGKDEAEWGFFVQNEGLRDTLPKEFGWFQDREWIYYKDYIERMRK